jgi:NitT/TauT family transport system permease protein
MNPTGTSLWQDVGATAIVFGFGYVIGTVSGILLGLIIGSVALVREVVEPFMAFANAVPKLLLLPIFLVLFGYGYVAQIVLVVVTITIFVLISTASGVAETSQTILNNAKVLGASRRALVRYVYVPSLAIWVLSTARQTVGYAMQAAIASEFIGASKGLGFRFIYAEVTIRSDEMFAAFAIVMLFALLVDAVLSLIEKRALRWMPATAGR